MRRGFKFKLKPKAVHRFLFVQFAGAVRWVFNRGLDQKQKSFEKTGKSPSYFEQNKELTLLKNQAETGWLGDIHSQVLQQSLKNLDRAFQNFFRKGKSSFGFPKFKKKGVKESFRFPQGVKVEDKRVFLPKIGWVAFHKSRDIRGTIKETTITQEGNNWFVSFSCEWEKPDRKPAPIDDNKAIGIDVGLSSFATTAAKAQNYREDIENPRFLITVLPRLRYLSRQLSKKVKRSKNSLKARLKLSKLHTRVKNLRHEFVHQLSTKMIKNHDIFCIESLDISSLLRTAPKGMARAISDAGWKSFLHCLKYKADEEGKYLVEAGKYFPSSQICASCHHQQPMPLSVRIYHCLNCGIKNDRDYNSALVLKAAGMSALKACGAALI